MVFPYIESNDGIYFIETLSVLFFLTLWPINVNNTDAAHCHIDAS